MGTFEIFAFGRDDFAFLNFTPLFISKRLFRLYQHNTRDENPCVVFFSLLILLNETLFYISTKESIREFTKKLFISSGISC